MRGIEQPTEQDKKLSAIGYAAYVRYLPPSDFGYFNGPSWRKIYKVGHINGLPSYNGVAFATNGILVAIRLANDNVVIGHMDSFIAVREAHSTESGKKRQDDKRLMMLEVEFV